ncbi:hypothetical protein [Agrobacterium cavarae]|uniref:hypothetical protein n=1 Tax=Agrobacterium cavarae TaxID=2528239 RepID=UPI00289851AB|nr:hypothetical protein [Agrobacterium cavarae]
MSVENLKKIREHLVKLRTEAAEHACKAIDDEVRHVSSGQISEVVALQEKIEVIDRAIADAEKSGYTYGILNNL